jgi:hypothetical protein
MLEAPPTSRQFVEGTRKLSIVMTRVCIALGERQA